MTSKVRVLLPPPRFAQAGYAWRSQAETVWAKRVRRSLSVAKAKTDWSPAEACAWRSQAETVWARRVRRSLSVAKAKTDGSPAEACAWRSRAATAAAQRLRR